MKNTGKSGGRYCREKMREHCLDNRAAIIYNISEGKGFSRNEGKEKQGVKDGIENTARV